MRLPFGWTQLDLAWCRFERNPIRLLDPSLDGKRVPTGVANVAFQLQILQRDKAILLPIEQLRERLEFRKSVVSGAVMRLVEADVIICTNSSYATGRARNINSLEPKESTTPWAPPSKTANRKAPPHAHCRNHRPAAALERPLFTGAEPRPNDNDSNKDSGFSFVYNWAKEGPMTIITPEIRKAIEQAGEQPVRLADPETNLVYIVVRAEVYERMRASYDDGDIQDAYPLMNQVAAREGWDDPSMDIYDEYQPPSE